MAKSDVKSDVKSDRRYTNDHEWARHNDAEVVVGITSFAVEQLGDITLVNVDAKPGDVVVAGKAFGTIESVKTLSDLFSPVSGKVIRVNAALETAPEIVNRDCWEEGWILAVQPSDVTELARLLDHEAYSALLATAANH
jgi:glycine cleavage system H protein